MLVHANHNNFFFTWTPSILEYKTHMNTNNSSNENGDEIIIACLLYVVTCINEAEYNSSCMYHVFHNRHTSFHFHEVVDILRNTTVFFFFK